MTKVLTLSIARTADGIGLPLPSYTSKYHMGLNLQVAAATAIRLGPGDRVYVPTGFAIGVPVGYCGFVVSLASLAHAHGVVVSDSPSLVSPANREPLFVLLQNISSQLVILHRGDIMAQLVVQPAVQVAWNDLTNTRSMGKVTKETDVLIDVSQTSDAESQEDKMHSSRRLYKGPRNRFAEENKDE